MRITCKEVKKMRISIRKRIIMRYSTFLNKIGYYIYTVYSKMVNRVVYLYYTFTFSMLVKVVSWSEYVGGGVRECWCLC